MNAQTSRKIIVASSMAVVFGIAVVLFAIRAHSVSVVPQTLQPPAPVAQIPAAAPAAAAESLAAPAAVNQATDAPAVQTADTSAAVAPK
jgi:hypothetical protein